MMFNHKLYRTLYNISAPLWHYIHIWKWPIFPGYYITIVLHRGAIILTGSTQTCQEYTWYLYILLSQHPVCQKGRTKQNVSKLIFYMCILSHTSFVTLAPLISCLLWLNLQIRMNVWRLHILVLTTASTHRGLFTVLVSQATHYFKMEHNVKVLQPSQSTLKQLGYNSRLLRITLIKCVYQ